MPKLKTPEDVPALVKALMDLSPDIGAVGCDCYVVIDYSRPEANAKIEQILRDFGPRDHLYFEIIECFRENGRDFEGMVPTGVECCQRMATVDVEIDMEVLMPRTSISIH